MTFQLQYQDGSAFTAATNKVVCVGQNYQAHIEEMGAAPAKNPVLFLKPATALCHMSQPIRIPQHGATAGQDISLHHEIELAVVIGTEAKSVPVDRVERHIAAYAAAIDLTLREVQSVLKQNGHPWEVSKAFDASCPISALCEKSMIEDWQDVEISLSVNEQLRQKASTSLMIHKIYPLISYISSIFTLEPGDVILTGTPAGVGVLQAGDSVQCTIAGCIDQSTFVSSL